MHQHYHYLNVVIIIYYTGGSKQRVAAEDIIRSGGRASAEVFTFRELALATENFNPELRVGEGGFGRVYKGYFNKTNQVYVVTSLSLSLRLSY